MSTRERFLANPVEAPKGDTATRSVEALAFHRRLPGYAPTPLRDLPRLADRLGVGRLLVKDESSRLGLPAFKMLGASWASYRALCERLGREPEWVSTDELARSMAELAPLTLTTATDGNHGRAVARFARLVGLQADIFVPTGTAPARIEAIESEGATVEVVDGTYDDAVARAAAADPSTSLVISDTSWEGYRRIPEWVIEGYDTIFGEIEDELDSRGAASPDVVVVPLGVGALGAAAAAYVERAWHEGVPRLLGVEPESAACVMASVVAGEITEVPGPHRSIMAGLNCGLPSPIAFDRLRRRFSAFVAIEDRRAESAMRALAAEGIVAGETGAATLAGLEAAIGLDAHGALALGAESTVLLLITEGASDPASYESIVRAPPHP